LHVLSGNHLCGKVGHSKRLSGLSASCRTDSIRKRLDLLKTERHILAVIFTYLTEGRDIGADDGTASLKRLCDGKTEALDGGGSQ